MSSLQKKGESWYCQFTFERQRHTYTLGKIGEEEARTTAARIDYLLMRVRQKLMEVPAGVDIQSFLAHDGKPPAPVRPDEAPNPVKTTLDDLRSRYLETFGRGALEKNSLDTAKIHLTHMCKTLGGSTTLGHIGHGDLQRHIDRRQDAVARVTIKKEIDTLMRPGTGPSARGWQALPSPAPGWCIRRRMKSCRS